MPTLYTENSEKWKALADIDYFTQFVKAWIPFNAWYKNYYPNLGTDRNAINEIKTANNSFRSRLLSLLEGSDNDSVVFRSYISRLHYQLERKYIYNRGKRVTFENIVIEQNTKKSETFLRNTYTYSVKRVPVCSEKNKEKIEIAVTDRNNVAKLSYIQIDGYDLDGLRANAQFQNLTRTQQANLEACYKEIDPHKPISLLADSMDDCIEMGDGISFISNTDRICKGLIEILYGLRNVLFHGEIVPDKDTNQVYEPAYHILNTLVHAL